MSDAAVLSHFRKKHFWMASHVENAQYPTPESLQGLKCYQAAETEPKQVERTAVSARVEGYSFYAVDCHPLMVRYARTLAQKWPEAERAALLEYLTQLSLTDIPTPDGINVSLYVAMQEGKPVATGMIFSTLEDNGTSVVGIYDVYGLTEEAEKAMRGHLATLTECEILVSE
ncbi:hypothetical protein [Enterovibrio sp. 27052020O]|uniref:hypothetical protein n=1 Tax=Enterovibrio sp. 27052020O TaxID=3241166 RepID=UPI00388E4906